MKRENDFALDQPQFITPQEVLNALIARKNNDGGNNLMTTADQLKELTQKALEMNEKIMREEK